MTDEMPQRNTVVGDRGAERQRSRNTKQREPAEQGERRQRMVAAQSQPKLGGRKGTRAGMPNYLGKR